ncbi:MAG: hypothetical protein ACI9F2_000203 [Lysobacterales bacterium]|jgi:hypothetical protein
MSFIIMKITIEYDQRRVIVENTEVIDVCDAIDLMERALIDIGYDDIRVRNAIVFRGSQIEEDRQT